MLTGNDTALAQTAVLLAIAWHESKPDSDFGKNEIEKLKKLNAKLDSILDSDGEPVADDDGEQVLLVSALG